MGVSGQELATSATRQAQKFGAKMAVARAIVQLRCQRRPYELVMDDGTVFFGRTIVIATGAYYNKPMAVSLERFANRGNASGRFQIRLDANNILNHTSFDVPNSTIGLAGSVLRVLSIRILSGLPPIRSTTRDTIHR